MKLRHKKMGQSFIVDNGAYTAKIGMTCTKHPEVVPNCIMKVKSERRRPFIGDQINECRDASGLFYILPFQRGYLVNWDIQKTVWDYIFAKEICAQRLSEIPLCITEPIFNFQSNQEAMDEIFFEEYESCGLLRVPASDLVAYHYSRAHNNICKNLIVVDSGYSFTHIIPYIDGYKYTPGIRRIDIGGKILTNHLKEIISYRQLHVMDETYVINQVKEDACYVSENFRSDMMTTSYKDKRNKIIREYILPDYSTIKRGYLRPFRGEDDKTHQHHQINGVSPKSNGIHKDLEHNLIPEKNLIFPNNTPEQQEKIATEQQTIVLNNERIAIPEILFHPSDIGIQQMGVAEAVVESIKSCPPDSVYSLLGNIVITGGNAMFQNFQKRLYAEVRSRFDELMTVNVTRPNNPVTYAWHGGRALTTDDHFFNYVITKSEYEEFGHNYAREHRGPFRIVPK